MLTISALLLLFFFGVYCNNWLNRQLKAIVGEPLRVPNSTSRFANPSGHAQLFAFMTTFFVAFALTNRNHEKFCWAASIFFLVMYITCWYVCLHHKFHTSRHLFWGTVVGILFGLAYVKCMMKTIKYISK